MSTNIICNDMYIYNIEMDGAVIGKLILLNTYAVGIKIDKKLNAYLVYA